MNVSVLSVALNGNLVIATIESVKERRMKYDLVKKLLPEFKFVPRKPIIALIGKRSGMTKTILEALYSGNYF